METIWNSASERDKGQGRADGEDSLQYALADAGELRSLTVDQVRLVDDALTRLGPFGEVRLIKEKGKLRFIQILESKSAL